MKDDWKTVNEDKYNNLKRLMDYCTKQIPTDTSTTADTSTNDQEDEIQSGTNQIQSTQSSEEVFFAPHVDATLYPFPLLTQIAKQTNNMVIKADALHYKTDVWVNAAVLVSLVAVYFTSYEIIDIIIGAGSDQVLEFAIHAVEPKKVLMSKTTFAMYEIYSKQVGAEILKTDSHEHNLDEFREKLKENPEIIFLCLPNNPLGECLDWEEVKKFIDEVDEDILIIIDGAYQEYASFKDKNKKIEPKWILNYPNVLYTGTFSKAYGLGGMRIGYGIANQTIISNLYKLRPPFNITTLSLKAGIIALQDEKFVNDSIEKNFIEMERYIQFCNKKGLKYIESWTNFITIFVEDSTKISDDLLKMGIIVRNLAGYGLNGIRITIGNKIQNDKVLNILENMI